MENDNTLTVIQIAQRYGVGDDTVRRWTKKGLLKVALRTPGGHARYELAEVERFARANNLPPMRPPA